MAQAQAAEKVAAVFIAPRFLRNFGPPLQVVDDLCERADFVLAINRKGA